jgi:hypothetical protein
MLAPFQAPFGILQLLLTPRIRSSQLPRPSTGMTDYTRALLNYLYVSQTMTTLAHAEDHHLTAAIVDRADMKHIGPPVSAHRVLTRSPNTFDRFYNKIRTQNLQHLMLPTLCSLLYSRYPYRISALVLPDSVIVGLRSSTTPTTPPSLVRPTCVKSRPIAWIA